MRGLTYGPRIHAWGRDYGRYNASVRLRHGNSEAIAILARRFAIRCCGPSYHSSILITHQKQAPSPIHTGISHSALIRYSVELPHYGIRKL